MYGIYIACTDAFNIIYNALRGRCLRVESDLFLPYQDSRFDDVEVVRALRGMIAGLGLLASRITVGFAMFGCQRASTLCFSWHTCVHTYIYMCICIYIDT